MKGYSTLEVLTVVAIAAILASMAWPSLADLVDRNRVVATVNSLVTALQQARHTSILQRTTTVACPAGGERCGHDWTAGWIVFTASSDWELADPIPATAIRYVGKPAPAVSVVANRRAFRFRPFSRSTNGTLTVCSRTANAVIVSVTGRVRSARVDTDGC